MVWTARQISPAWPAWYDPSSPLGSAVRYVAALSPKFNWAGIYLLKGKAGGKQFLALGPYLGAPTDHKHIPIGVGVCGTAVAQNKDMNIADVTQIENYLACSIETR